MTMNMISIISLLSLSVFNVPSIILDPQKFDYRDNYGNKEYSAPEYNGNFTYVFLLVVCMSVCTCPLCLI